MVQSLSGISMGSCSHLLQDYSFSFCSQHDLLCLTGNIYLLFHDVTILRSAKCLVLTSYFFLLPSAKMLIHCRNRGLPHLFIFGILGQDRIGQDLLSSHSDLLLTLAISSSLLLYYQFITIWGFRKSPKVLHLSHYNLPTTFSRVF